MTRVKINHPEQFHFSTNIAIRITDINYGNHAGNQVYLEWMQEARVRFLQQFGYGELDVEGVGLIMADAAIEYKAALLYGDAIEVSIAVSEISATGFVFTYFIKANRNDQLIIAAKAKTGMVCYNYKTKKVVAIPPAVKDILSNLSPI